MLSAIGNALNLSSPSRRDDLKEDIEKLDRKLRRIQATVEEVENREIHDGTVNLWLEELKCLVGKAEDVLDEYNYEIFRCQLEARPAGTTILSGQVTDRESNSAIKNHVSFYFLKSISVDMIEKIKQINSRFDEISRDREYLQLTNEEAKRRAGVSSINLSSTSHLMNKDNIFGRSIDQQKIIDLLLSEDEAELIFRFEDDIKSKDQIKVIPILGMGGIGKTTLAQIVYNDNLVQHYFDVMAWVYVSPEFDIIRLTKEIYDFVAGDTGNSLNGFSSIQEELQKKLVGKIMLLVLDDVWNVQQNDWEMLFLPLRVAKMVRVLVTSRNDVVAMAPHAVSPYRLHVLPENECLQLLFHCAFGGKRTSVLKESSLHIAILLIKKCGRLPLAVKCIGRVLHCIKDQDCWWEILDSELWESVELDPMFCALKVSYYHLPTKLRDCFMFCSMFPKGSRLGKNSIIYMWMAHRFLQPKGRKRAEDIGAEYLAELQMRSFIVPCTKSSFCLHDVIYDLARSLSEGKIHTIVNKMSSCIHDKIEHLYIKKGNNPCESFRPQLLRTLFDATERPYDSFIDVQDIRLRVLGLIGPSVIALLEHSRLKHLRYLAIMEFNGKTLPESLCLLYHMQTLEITRCYGLSELPKTIANLVNLCYLRIAHTGIKELPLMLWKVKNLQMLRLKECYNLRMAPLGISNLTNLHTFELKSCKQVKELPADIGHIINFSVLNLSYSEIRTFPASMVLLKSTTIVLVGLPDSVKEELCFRLEIWSLVERCNGFTGVFWEDEETLIVVNKEGLSSLSHHKQSNGSLKNQPEHPSKFNQELIPSSSQPWQMIRNENTAAIGEDIDFSIAEDIDYGIAEDNDFAITKDTDSLLAEDTEFGIAEELYPATAEGVDIGWAGLMSSQNQSFIGDYDSRWQMSRLRARFRPRVRWYKRNEMPTNLAQGQVSPVSRPAIVEDIDFGSQVTWMSSQNQNSATDYDSYWQMPRPKDDARSRPRVIEHNGNEGSSSHKEKPRFDWLPEMMRRLEELSLYDPQKMLEDLDPHNS